MRVYSQKNGHACFVYALANCCSYHGLKQDKNFVHLFHDLCDEAKNGPMIEKQRAIKEMGLTKIIHQTDRASDIKYGGGIIAILHPIWNLHAVFVSPVDKNRCMAYNSWLGPSEMCITWDEILRFTNHRCCSHWYMPDRNDTKGDK